MHFLRLVSTFTCLAFAAAMAIQGFSAQESLHLTKDPKVTHKVTFTIHKGTEKVGDLVLALFGETVPETVRNYVELAKMSQGYGYEKTHFHRIVKGFMIQGGDFEKGDGTGGHSIYNKGHFDDENFKVHHNKKGRLSMANSGKNTNGAQFFITTAQDCKWLDNLHVVFGQLVQGFDVLDKLDNAAVDQSKPKEEWTIASASVLDMQLQVVEDSLSGYVYFFCFCLVVAAVWAYKNIKKLAIIDIKG